MAFDTFRCPQNEEECKTWFYEGIGKQPGAAADNWLEVMDTCGLEAGYGPGVRPNASMPNFAITQQYRVNQKVVYFCLQIGRMIIITIRDVSRLLMMILIDRVN